MKTTRELEDMTNVRADFDSFISQGNEEQARACIDIMGESYSELEALKMHKEANSVFNHEPKELHEREEERAMEREIETDRVADIW